MTEQTAHPPLPVISPPDALEFLNRAGTVLAASLDYEQTLRDVAQLAVPEIADWCAVLVVEPDGQQREMTSEHPDAEVEAAMVEVRRRRRASQGSSESLLVLSSGRSVLATDIRGNVAEDVLPDERAAIERIAPRSYMIVPLLARGRVIGALTLLSTREGRHYTSDDLRFAETLAVRCALAIDNARLYDESERSLALLDTWLSTAPVGLGFLDNEGRFVRVNAALAAMGGQQAPSLLGLCVADFPGDLGAHLESLREAVVAGGEPVLNRELSGETNGEARHWVSSCTPVRAADGQLIGTGLAVIDNTERRALLEGEREARLRAGFLAEAGAILDSSLDYEETLAKIAPIAVPEIADWCAVSLLDGSGILQEVVASHVDPARRAVGDELSQRFPPDPTSETGTYKVARSGVTEFVRVITDEMLVAGLPDEEQLALVRKLGLRSLIIAPLKARDRIFGTLTLASAESGRIFADADVQLAEELARRAATAIDNARLYTERTRIAHTLQASLLPSTLPQVPGAEISARYRAAGELNEVGGDFYDVFARSRGEWAMVVGDVSGKGASAAAVTALARYTLRAVAPEDPRPSRALERLNAAMLADGSSQFATVVLVYARADGRGAVRVRVSLGGHPPPLIVRGDGRIDATGAFGTLLGAYQDPLLTDTEHTLAERDAMVLYTDGVTEAGARDALFGEDGLAALLRGVAGRAPSEIVDAVERAVVDAQVGDPRDDIALVALSARRALG